MRLTAALLFAASLFPIQLSAADEGRRMFAIPAGSAEKSLKMFSEQAGRGLVMDSDLVKTVHTKAVQGEFTAREALDRMLTGTGLVAAQDDPSGAFTVHREVPRPNASRAAPTTRSDRPQNQTRVPSEQETERVVELSPFTVTGSQDVGYLAANTLAGSRLNTALKDTAASITVFTREFLDDLGATDLAEALLFANNLQFNDGDEGAFGDTPNGNALLQQNRSYRVRGIAAQLARNYFRWDLPSDMYNVGRVEDSRGPNSVLFGIGSAGGVINVATKQAELQRKIRSMSLVVDNQGSRRAALDLNQPLGDKAAVRVNAVWNDQQFAMHHAFSESKRVHLAAKYRFFPKWQARIEYETGDLEMNRGRNTGTFDFVLPWLQAGRPTFALTAPTSAFSSLGTRLGNNQPRYISNRSQLVNMTGQILTRGSNLPIVDQSIAHYSIGSGGPGQVRENPFDALSAFLEGQLGSHSSVEFGFNHQAFDWEGHDPFTVHQLYGDSNATLPGDLGVNPNAGRLFMETPWRLSKREESVDTIRAAFATEYDFGRWGRYRAAVLGEYEDTERRGGNRFELWEGAPFNASPIAAANRVIRRTYVTEGQWDTYWVEGPRMTGLLKNVTDAVTGRVMSSTFDFAQSVDDDPTEQWSGLLGLQAAWFGGRVVAGTGYREDHISIHNRGQKQDAAGRFVVDYDTVDVVEDTGRTYTLGLVGHLNNHVSLLYNMASNIATPNGGLTVLPNLSLADPPEGKGEDYGIAFQLPDQKLYVRAVRFTTASKGEMRAGTTGTRHVATSNGILDALQTAHLITPAEFEKRYFFGRTNFVGETLDRETEGYEVSVTGNPTKNWRLTINYSQTKGAEEKIIAEVVSWWTEARQFFTRFPQNTPLADGVSTIGTEIGEEDDYIANVRSVEGVGIIGNRKHKVSAFARYTFSGGWFKGAYLGGGYRYQGQMLTGIAPDGATPLFAPPYGEASFLAGYNVRLRNRHRVGLQLNIANLFDETDPIVTRYATSGNLHHPRRMIIREPRTMRLTANFSF